MWALGIESASCHPSGAWDLEVAPKFLEIWENIIIDVLSMRIELTGKLAYMVTFLLCTHFY